jgi:hypothetical protein
VLAQSASKPRVALLFGGRPSDSTDFVNALLGELRTLGYQEGRTVEIDARHADYSPAQAERLATEIAGRKPAVIVASGGGIEPAVRWRPASRGVRPQRQSRGCRLRRQPVAPGRNATGYLRCWRST